MIDPRPGKTEREQGDPPSVLVVDDEKVIRLALQAKLSERFSVATVGSAEEALEQIAGRPPDVMLVDKNLPGMSGIELLRKTKHEWPEIEVILITGYASIESAVEALRLGAYDYLVKPLPDLSVVADRVSRAAERKRLLAERDELVGRLHDSNQALEGTSRRLERSEERFRLMFEQMTSGVMVTDRTGVVEMANPAAAGILGMDRKTDLRGLRLEAAVPGAGEMLRETPSGERGQVWLRSGQRESRPLGYATRRMEDGERRITVFSDLSAVVEADRRRRRAEQLALVGEMAARLSHEIKNPLGAMLVGLRVLERGGMPEAERKQTIQDLLEDIGRLDDVVRQLLSQSGTTRFDPYPAGLSVVVEDIVRSYRAYCQSRGVELSAETSATTITVVIDPTWLRRIVGNLLLNAADAAGAGGHVRVRTGLLESDEREKRFGAARRDVAWVEVTDDGPGIPPAERRNIFEPFWTTKSSGTGLGLTVALELIEDSGSLLEVDSREGRGTVFRVLLPAGDRPGFDPEDDSCPADCPARRSPPAGQGKGCWVEVGRAVKAETGRWPVACQRCPVFVRANLAWWSRANAESNREQRWVPAS